MDGRHAAGDGTVVTGELRGRVHDRCAAAGVVAATAHAGYRQYPLDPFRRDRGPLRVRGLQRAALGSIRQFVEKANSSGSTRSSRRCGHHRSIPPWAADVVPFNSSVSVMTRMATCSISRGSSAGWTSAGKLGIRYLEIAHLFTQWGAEFAPQINVDTAHGLEHRFGWHTNATDPQYRRLLAVADPGTSRCHRTPMGS